MNNENKRWEHVLLVTRVSASLISLTDRWRIRNVPSNEGCSSVAAPAPHRSLIRAEYSHNICPIRDHLSGPASECDIYWSLTVSHMLACSPCDMGQWGSCGAGVPGVRALWLQDNHRDHHCLSQSTRRENINTNLHNLPYLNPHGERVRRLHFYLDKQESLMQRNTSSSRPGLWTINTPRTRYEPLSPLSNVCLKVCPKV